MDPALTSLRVELEIPIAAPRARVWNALVTETSSWWRADFYVGKSPKAFHFEAKVGGRVYEDWGEGNGFLWYTVVEVESGVALRLAGHLMPDSGNSLGTTLLHLRLEEDGAGGTSLFVVNLLFGQLAPGLAKALESMWQMLLGEALKAHCERPA